MAVNPLARHEGSPRVAISLEKLPPQNLEAEQSVLGAVLLDNHALNRALELLSPDDFYKEAHRRIFQAILDLYERNEAIDLVTLTETLRQRNDLDSVGGAAYLTELVNAVPTAANISYHARIVHEKSLVRQLVHTATEIAARGYESSERIEELLDYAEQRVFSISDAKMKPSFYPIRELVKDSFELIERRYEQKENVTGVPTGFSELDNLTAGLHPGDLIIIAGRPGMGKTALALNIAQHAAVEKHLPVAIFSLEMAREQLVIRMLCAEARVDAHKLRSGYLGTADWPKLTAAAGRITEAPLFVDDTAALSVLELRAKARRLKREHGLEMVIVDYLQLMRGRGDADTREQEISEISRSLKALAKELRVPVIALSQLSRAVESRTERRPQLSDLRECVTGDTLVYLRDGGRIPIQNLVGTAPEVLAVSTEGKVTWAACDKAWCVGQHPVFTVRLASGRFIRATAEHRLLGWRGWQKVCDLRSGDRLAIARQIPEPVDAVEWPEARIMLLAHLIGDGSYLSHQPLRYTTSSEENSKAVAQAAVQEFGANVKRYPGRGRWHQLVLSGNGNRWHPSGVNRWLREIGVFNQRSHEKRIPEEVFRLKNGQITLLLRHLWATDGTISPRGTKSRGSPGVFFSTSSQGLAYDVAALLLRLRIVARIKRVDHLKYRSWYNVIVSGADQLRCFLETVEAFGPRRSGADKLMSVLKTLRPNTNVDTLPREVFTRVRETMVKRGISQRTMASLRGTSYGGTSHFRFSPSRAVVADYAEILDDEVLRMQATSDLFWDRVTETVPDGMEAVYDLTVPGHGSWLAEGIVSHNSGAIEQDADLVMFVYREELYRQTEENRNMAKIIVSKQRNGPTGDIDLVFLKEYTRFMPHAPGF